ncbi:MAG TPA: hypothetical protein VG502_07150 [Flexivirga sp.]|uniref:hypothetical protein n=1 Tax=Actinomycetes TaxID=1760 RepID=UPI002BF59ADD|nr:hypothetical protein [Flexivirga sp.]HWC22061.1 hypothetical protein [Flexivirga sp.]
MTHSVLQPVDPDRRRRGSLFGLATVIALFTFFLADSLPGAFNAVAAFFLAFGIIVVAFAMLLAVALLVTRLRRPARVALTALDDRDQRRPPRATALDGPVFPPTRGEFVRAADELLAAAGRLDYEGLRLIEDGLWDFVDLDRWERRDPPLRRLREVGRFLPLTFELEHFIEVAEHATTEQVTYLRSILRARRDLW